MAKMAYLTPASGPARYAVEYNGKVLVQSARDPEHDACRALLARGITGKVTFVWKASGTPGLSMDIERGAGLTVEDNKSGRPVFRPYRGGGAPSAREQALGGLSLPEAA